MQTEQANGRATRDIDRKRYPGVMRTHKTLRDGSRVTYFYHRPTKTRLMGEPGTEAFDAEYREAIRRRFRGRPRKVAQERPLVEATTVYLIRAVTTGLIKIGKATDPARRLSVLQVGSPDRLEVVALIPDPLNLLERRLHMTFAKQRSHGEWYRPCADLEALIKTHAHQSKAAAADLR